MKEIGGYFELERFDGKEYHPQAYALNAGRNAIACVVKARAYKVVYIPDFCCDSVSDGVKKGGAVPVKYRIDKRMRPIFSQNLSKKEAILIVNYYGQLDNTEIASYKKKFQNLILDNTQAFFQKPVPHVDTTYSCRKFFGVADGAYLYTDIKIPILPQDMSAERMLFVLGRFEEPASKYYSLSAKNNEIFTKEPVKKMSRLTRNLLCGINYKQVAEKRMQNAIYLHKYLQQYNRVEVKIMPGMFMYPFMMQKFAGGGLLRKKLQQSKIYVPCLWPDTLQHENSNTIAYWLADNIVPLPCDQRYSISDMQEIINEIDKVAHERIDAQ